MTDTTPRARRTKATTKPKPVQAAEAEGLLDRRLLDRDPATWPTWARARYGVDHPVGELIEPLTVSEVDR